MIQTYSAMWIRRQTCPVEFFARERSNDRILVAQITGWTGDASMLSVFCGRWWILLLRGMCAIAIGIAAILWPAITVLTLVWMFALFMIADGVASTAIGFRGEADGTVWWTMVFVGALAILAGVVTAGMALVRPELTLATMVILVGASAILRGVVEILAAIRLRKVIDDEWLLGLSGFLSILFGALIISRPDAGVVAMGILIGAFMLLLGTLAVALSLRLRRLGQRIASGQQIAGGYT
jgi:uncharacterized membrane protein HdeD (DUF308 family)